MGLGFGAEFTPIYQRHPNAEMAAICQRNPETLKESAALANQDIAGPLKPRGLANRMIEAGKRTP